MGRSSDQGLGPFFGPRPWPVFRAEILAHFSGQDLGPKSGLRFWCHISSKLLRAVRKSSAKNGPCSWPAGRPKLQARKAGRDVGTEFGLASGAAKRPSTLARFQVYDLVPRGGPRSRPRIRPSFWARKVGTRGLVYRKVISEAGLSPFSGTRSWTEKRAEFSAHFSVPEAGPKSGPSSQPVFRYLILCRNTGQDRRPIFGLGTRPVLRAKKTARFRFAIRGFAAHFFTARASAATRVLSQAAPRRALFWPIALANRAPCPSPPPPFH